MIRSSTTARRAKDQMREKAGELREEAKAIEEVAGQLDVRWDRSPEIRDGYKKMARWYRDGVRAMREQAMQLDREANGEHIDELRSVV